MPVRAGPGLRGGSADRSVSDGVNGRDAMRRNGWAVRGATFGLAMLLSAAGWAQTAIPVPGPTVEGIKRRG